MFKILVLCAIIYSVASFPSFEDAHEIEKRSAFDEPKEKEFWGLVASGVGSLVGKLINRRRTGEFEDSTDPTDTRFNWSWVKPVAIGAINGAINHWGRRAADLDSATPEEIAKFRADLEEWSRIIADIEKPADELKDLTGSLKRRFSEF